MSQCSCEGDCRRFAIPTGTKRDGTERVASRESDSSASEGTGGSARPTANLFSRWYSAQRSARNPSANHPARTCWLASGLARATRPATRLVMPWFRVTVEPEGRPAVDPARLGYRARPAHRDQSPRGGGVGDARRNERGPDVSGGPGRRPAGTRLRREQSDFLQPQNREGEKADFHSLRHTAGAWLALAGNHPEVVQTVMRHSSITLTMDTYGHLFPGQDAEAVASLPDILGGDIEAPDAQRATGRTGERPKSCGRRCGGSQAAKRCKTRREAANRAEAASTRAVFITSWLSVF